MKPNSRQKAKVRERVWERIRELEEYRPSLYFLPLNRTIH